MRVGCIPDRASRTSASSPAALSRVVGYASWPVAHDGNQSASLEEADMVLAFVRTLMGEGATWIDRDGDEQPLRLEDILIIAPYNAQVFALQERLPGGRIGTVDKFQGQEAPLVIYSMATSAPTDAPHGMEFLYSLNRLNVATSRARCASVLVANRRCSNWNAARHSRCGLPTLSAATKRWAETIFL